MMHLATVRRKVLITQLSCLFLLQMNFPFCANAAEEKDETSAHGSVPVTSSLCGSEFSVKPILPSDSLLLASASPLLLGSEMAAAAGEGLHLNPLEVDDPRLTKIDSLTKKILLKEIALQRFNLRYTMAVAKQGRWKGWRYAALQEANAGTGLAGAIISVGYRGARLHNAHAVKPCIQESANYVPMIGSIIGASAATIEFGVNSYHDIVAGKHGFSPKLATAYVGKLKKEVDDLLLERDAAVQLAAQSPELAPHIALDKVEGQVLHDIHLHTMQEFERFHVGARRLLAFQQSQYFFDFLKYTTNAIGYEFAYLSLHRHHRVWNGRAGALFAVSGALTIFAPILSRGVGKMVGEFEKHRLNPLMTESSTCKIGILQNDLATLDHLCKTGVACPDTAQKAAERLALYDSHRSSFDQEIRTQQSKNAAAKLVATQNVGAGAYVGGTKLASGILFLIPGFNHHYNTTGPRADRVTNDLLFTASLVAIPSGAFAMLDTLRIQVKGEINRQKQMKAGTLPSQIVAKRMKELDAMEAKLSL